MTDQITSSPIPTVKRADNEKWLRFSEIITLTLGAGLLLSGIIFFFAFNWNIIHRFTKMGIVLGLLLATFAVVVKVPMRDWVRNITIFAMCVLVGAFLAVYGQVYQTGADSYLLFLTWSLCIVVWVAVADFYPLWAFFIALVALTYSLIPFVKIGLFDFIVILGLFILFFEYTPRFVPNRSIAPKWFMTILISIVYSLAVITMICAFFFNVGNLILDFFTSIAVSVCTWYYANQKKNLLLYSLFCIGILIEVYVLFCRITNNVEAMFFISFPFMAAVFFLGKHIIEKKKKWEEETMPTIENSNNE